MNISWVTNLLFQNKSERPKPMTILSRPVVSPDGNLYMQVSSAGDFFYLHTWKGQTVRFDRKCLDQLIVILQESHDMYQKKDAIDHQPTQNAP